MRGPQPRHGKVDPAILGAMECCGKCVEVRSQKPFMSAVYERDYTPAELALLHVIYHEELT